MSEATAQPMLAFRYGLARGGFALDAAAELDGRGITGVFGPSGAGKTTLLRCLAGLEPAEQAHCMLADQVLDDSATRRRVPPDARNVGYVFQEPRLFPHLDVRQNLLYGRKRRGGAQAVSFEAVVALLGLAALLTRKPAGLSGGEAQRVAIGRAVLSAPRLLLMDEPVAALDAGRREEILPFIRELHAEFAIPVLYVTHSMDELCSLCDQLLLLDGGRVVAAGDLQALLLTPGMPLLGGAHAGVLLDATVTNGDAGDGLCELESGAGRWFIPGPARSGERFRLRIRAGDVSLSRDVDAASSILNRLPVTVHSIEEETAHSVLVHLAAGSEQLLARITRRSLRELDIRPGEQLTAQVKSVSLRQPRA